MSLCPGAEGQSLLLPRGRREAVEAQWRGRSAFQEVMMGRDWQYCPSEGLHSFIRFSLGFSPPTSERKPLTVQVGTHPSAAWQVVETEAWGKKIPCLVSSDKLL